MYAHLEELKEHVRITEDDYEFDRELQRMLSSANNVVKAYLTITTDEHPEANLIKLAVLELACYYFDNKGRLNTQMIDDLLQVTVGHLREPTC